MERLDELVPTIHIADDDELICMLVSRALRSRGYNVTVSHTRSDSINACASERCELAIVDAHMPGLDLKEALSAMAVEQPLPQVLVISGDAARPEWLPTHIAYLPKPFGLTELISEVNRLLGLANFPTMSREAD